MVNRPNTSKVLFVGTGSISSHFLSLVLMHYRYGLLEKNLEMKLLGSSYERIQGIVKDFEDAKELLAFEGEHKSDVTIQPFDDHGDTDSFDFVVTCFGDGNAQKLAESRNDVYETHRRKLEIFASKTREILQRGFPIGINLTNPVELISLDISELMGVPPDRILAIGLEHDTARARLISGSPDVQAFGNHGDVKLFPSSMNKWELETNARGVQILRHKNGQSPLFSPSISLFNTFLSLVNTGKWNGLAAVYDSSSNTFKGGKVSFSVEGGLLNLSSPY